MNGILQMHEVMETEIKSEVSSKRNCYKQLQNIDIKRSPGGKCIYVLSKNAFLFHQSLRSLCQRCCMEAAAIPTLFHRQLSEPVTFHCTLACCVTQWSVTLVFNRGQTVLQALNLPLVFPHISLCGRTCWSGAT